MKAKDGCAFGLVTRERVEETQRCIGQINDKLDRLDTRMTELFNHQSSRWPPAAAWSLGIIGTILGGVVSAAFLNFFGGN